MRYADDSSAACLGMRAVRYWPFVVMLFFLWQSLIAGAQEQQRMFDLPAGPLKQTLAQYDRMTDLSVFYSSELILGRISAPLKGLFSAEDALYQLLKGTGLTVKVAAEDAFVLVPVSEHDIQKTAVAATMATHYSQLVQTHIVQALCANDTLDVGRYRLALLLNVDVRGRVQHVRLLDTSGKKQRDDAIVAMVEHIDIGRGPVDPDKPFVILIKPRDDAAQLCASYH